MTSTDGEIELTPEEIANGWTLKSLAEHRRKAGERQAEATNERRGHKPPRPARTMSDYDPMRW